MPPKICAFLVALLIGVGVASGTRTEDHGGQQGISPGKQLVIPGYKKDPSYKKNHPTYYETWDEAREACKKKGGDLAMKLTDEEMKFVFGSYWPKTFYGAKTWVWYGGVRSERAKDFYHFDSYEWLDGTPIPRDYDLWQRAEPQRGPGSEKPSCLVLRPNNRRKGPGDNGPALLGDYCNGGSYWERPALCEIPNQRHKYFAVNPDW